MTVLETRSLAPNDLVTWGTHFGRVVGVAPFTVSVEWTPGKTTVHRRDQMTAVGKAEFPAVRAAGS